MTTLALLDLGPAVALGGLLFAVGTLVSVWKITSAAAVLRLSPRGMELLRRRRRRSYAWDEIEVVRVHEARHRTGTHRFVGFDIRGGGRPSRRRSGRGSTGTEVDVSLRETYGLDAHTLARGLDGLRRRFRTASGSGVDG